MKNVRTLLNITRKHLATAKALLTEKSRAVRQAKDSRQRETARLARDTIKAAVEGLEDHREILAKQRARQKVDRLPQ